MKMQSAVTLMMLVLLVAAVAAHQETMREWTTIYDHGRVASDHPGVIDDEEPLRVTVNITAEKPESTANGNDFALFPPLAAQMLRGNVSRVEFSACGGRERASWSNGDNAWPHMTHFTCGMPTLSIVADVNATEAHQRIASALGPTLSSTFTFLARPNVPLHKRPFGQSTFEAQQGEAGRYASVHSAHSEPFCTQQLTPLFLMFPGSQRPTHSSSGMDGAETRPLGHFRAYFPLLSLFFATKLHEVRFSAARTATGLTASLQTTFVLTSAAERSEFAKHVAQVKGPHASPLAAESTVTLRSHSSAAQQNPKDVAEIVAFIKSTGSAPSSKGKANIGVSGRLVQDGEVSGEWKLTVDFPTGAKAALLLVSVPRHVITVYWSTLKAVKVWGDAVSRILHVEEDVPSNTQLVWLLVPNSGDTSQQVLTARYLYAFSRVDHYPPDMNKPFLLPQVIAAFDDAAKAEFAAVPHAEALRRTLLHPIERGIISNVDALGMRWGRVFLSHGVPFVTSLPGPDVAMPFNAMTLACTTFVLLFGSLYNILVKDSAREVPVAETGPAAE